ncbi:MAG: signal peptidase II [Propionibacteriaceae bacterium]|nr:signal peptidase II [Propionibacteriaceae bacterium]
MYGLQAARGTAIIQKGFHISAKHFALAVCIGLAGWGIDFFTKQAALALLDSNHPISVLGDFVRLRLLFNSGAAFSMGEEFTVAFTCFAIAALLAVLIFLVPRVRHAGWAIATGLLISGISGNLTDRLLREPQIFYGRVVDFLELKYFAVINFADICITAAAVMIIWFMVIMQIDPSGTKLKNA